MKKYKTALAVLMLVASTQSYAIDYVPMSKEATDVVISVVLNKGRGTKALKAIFLCGDKEIQLNDEADHNESVKMTLNFKHSLNSEACVFKTQSVFASPNSNLEVQYVNKDGEVVNYTALLKTSRRTSSTPGVFRNSGSIVFINP